MLWLKADPVELSARAGDGGSSVAPGTLPSMEQEQQELTVL